MRDTDTYRKLYEELKNYGGSVVSIISRSKMNNSFKLPSNDENDRLDMTSENLQDVVSEAQIFQIQQQILAYKTLVKSTNIPRDVEKNIFALSKDQWEVEKERLLQRTVKYYHERVEKNEDLKKLISRYSNKKPLQAATEQDLGEANKDQEQKELEQEETVKGNTIIDKRKREIAKFASSGCLTQQAKLRLEREAKFLDTLPFYYEVKETILRKLIDDKPSLALERALLDRKRHTREKPARKYEHRMMEKIENQMKTEHEFRKKIRNRELIHMLFEHQARFFEHHKKKGKIVKKRGLAVKNYLEMLEKRGKIRFFSTLLSIF